MLCSSKVFIGTKEKEAQEFLTTISLHIHPPKIFFLQLSKGE